MLSFVPIALPVIVSYILGAIVIGLRRHIPIRQQLLTGVFFVYLLAVVAISWFPIPLQNTGVNLSNNFVPFRTIMGILGEGSLTNDFRVLVGNILLFAPFTVLFPWVFRAVHKWVPKALAIGFGIALLMQSGQVVISAMIGFRYRSFDVDALILNAIGLLLGCLAFWVRQRILPFLLRLRSKRSWVFISPVLVLLIVTGYWGYARYSRATAVRAFETHVTDTVLPLDGFRFGGGVVLLTTTPPRTLKPPGYVAWYMTRSEFWGWRLTAKSVTGKRISGAMVVDGKTLVWGNAPTTKLIAKVVRYRHLGQVFTLPVDTDAFGLWHVSLPFAVRNVGRRDWTVAYGPAEPVSHIVMHAQTVNH